MAAMNRDIAQMRERRARLADDAERLRDWLDLAPSTAARRRLEATVDELNKLDRLIAGSRLPAA